MKTKLILLMLIATVVCGQSRIKTSHPLPKDSAVTSLKVGDAIISNSQQSFSYYINGRRINAGSILTTVDSNKSKLSPYTLGNVFKQPQKTYFSFNSKNTAAFTIGIDDCGQLAITYGKETKPSEAVKDFFKWLMEYQKQNYYIIKKEDLDKLLGK